MKRVFFLISVLGVLGFLTNCGEDTKDGKVDEPLTPEDNKALIQNIGVEFFNEMATLQETSSVQSLTAFGLLLEEDEEDPEGGRVTGSGSVKRMAKNIVAFANGRITAIEFGHQAHRLNQEPEEDEFTSLQELFDESTGTYEWNPDTEEFDFTDDSEDEVIFNYPSTEGGASNNASLILSNYTGITIANPIDEEYEGDLPTTLDVELKVDGTTEMTYGFVIDYNDEGVPESVETELTLNDYSLSVDLTNTDTKIGATVNLSNASKTLIEVSSEVNGDFSDEAIEGADESGDPTEVVNNGNFSMTLLNLKFSADLQFANLYNEVGGEDFEDEYSDSDEEKPDLEANATLMENALNEYASLKLTYVDTGKPAADVEWYTYTETDEDWHYIEYGARMVFEDESKVDVEDFLATGFEELEDAINNLIHQIEEDIHEDLEDVDFGDL